MKYPRINTLRGAFLPVSVVNWVFGVGIIEYPTGRRYPVISFCCSVTNLCVFVMFWDIANLSSVSMMQGSALVAENYRQLFRLYAIFISICLVVGYTKAKSLANVVNAIISVNEKLKMLGVTEKYDAMFRSQIWELASATVAIVIIMILDFIFVGYEISTTRSRIAYLCAGHYMLVFDMLLAWSIKVSISYVADRFECLNAFLTRLDHETQRIETQRFVVDDSKQRVSDVYSELIAEIQDNYLLVRSNERAQWMVQVIRESRIIHSDLRNAAKSLNAACSLQMLASITMCFVVNVLLTYTTFVLTTYPDSPFSTLQIIFNVSSGVFWMTFQCTKVFTVIRACSKTGDEAQRTGHVIQRILTPTIDNDVREEINFFMYQLVQGPVHFTACGFFTMDLKLLRKMWNSVLTFFVIMVQMRAVLEY